MGEEKELKKQSLPVPLSNTKLTASIWRCINTPHGGTGPPYRSGVDGHKNARHGFLAGFPAVSL